MSEYGTSSDTDPLDAVRAQIAASEDRERRDATRQLTAGEIRSMAVRMATEVSQGGAEFSDDISFEEMVDLIRGHIDEVIDGRSRVRVRVTKKNTQFDKAELGDMTLSRLNISVLPDKGTKEYLDILPHLLTPDGDTLVPDLYATDGTSEMYVDVGGERVFRVDAVSYETAIPGGLEAALFVKTIADKMKR